MAKPAFIFDGRNILPHDELQVRGDALVRAPLLQGTLLLRCAPCAVEIAVCERKRDIKCAVCVRARGCRRCPHRADPRAGGCSALGSRSRPSASQRRGPGARTCTSDTTRESTSFSGSVCAFEAGGLG
eukprot:1039675-Rhodomonas_salina.1